ncbi:NAD(P)/FAD-dependent oxidoreductase [Lutibaculum baratangense]|nr:FAD-binding oxidoreductase [Lutibaculum baratangense]
MSNTYKPANDILPKETEVVVIGGGIAGIFAAYYLAKAGVPVVVCEKGRIAGEQSSRNWGWIRKQGRDPRELPLAIESLRRWADIAPTLPDDIGFHVGGVTYLAETDADLAEHEAWLEHAKQHQLDTRLLSSAETDAMLGQDKRRFKGAMFTPSDARAEPGKAIPAVARAARAEGARILERLAVRTLETEGGRVTGVVTERGTIRCRAVLLAGGAWSRAFLENIGLSLPQLAVKASVQRTAPAPLITESAVGGHKAAIRRRQDGGYTLARSSAATFDIIPAAFTHFLAFLPILREQWRIMTLRFGRPFFDALGQRRWGADQMSPFEQMRVLDPEPDTRLLDDVLASAGDLFPQLRDARAVERWAGMIDVTPDEIPVMGPVPGREGLFVSTGYSGHGFGIGAGAGLVMAEMLRGHEPSIDISAFRMERFKEKGGVWRPKAPLPV